MMSSRPGLWPATPALCMVLDTLSRASAFCGSATICWASAMARSGSMREMISAACTTENPACSEVRSRVLMADHVHDLHDPDRLRRQLGQARVHAGG